MQLTGKLAVVTGGGRGIGRGIVERFLDEGAQVAVVQRRPVDPELLAHPGAHAVQADLSDIGALPEVVERACAVLGGIDVLVNNAGVMVEQEVAAVTPSQWEAMMTLNLSTPLFLIQAALPYLDRRGGGSIINVGSIEGLAANPAHAAYCASKAGLHGLTRALAVDLGPKRVRCNVIAPGWISSELSENYLESMPDPQAARAALDSLHPMGRTGLGSDVGDLAVFLAGDRSTFITGETIGIDGGRMAKLPQPR